MRAKTVDRLKSAVDSTPELFAVSSGAMADFKLPDAAVDSIYHVLGALEAWGASTSIPPMFVRTFLRTAKTSYSFLREPTNDVSTDLRRALDAPQGNYHAAMVLVQIHL